MSGFPWGQLSAELWLVGLGLVLLLVDLLPGRDERRGRLIGGLAFAGLLLGLVPASGACAPDGASPLLFGGLFAVDDFQIFFRLFVLLSTALVVLLSFDYLEHITIDRGVFFALLVFGALAMCLLAGSRDLVMVYLAIEFLSITSYVLAAFLLGGDRDGLGATRRSLEAGLKYLIYGAVASGIMVYGFSLMYGLAGSTSLEAVGAAFAGPGNQPIKLLALLMALAGFTFKVSAVPFWQWAPDVYEGAPTPVAAFLAVGSKGAGIAVLVRFLTLSAGGFAGQWETVLALIAVLTMFTGNLLALVQTNLKRLMAYSGIAHAGYLLVGLVCNDEAGRGVQAMLIYLLAYLIMTIGVFAIIVWQQRRTGRESIESLSGLAQEEPWMAVALTILLLSLVGIPPTVGFIGKLHLLVATVNTPYLWLGLMIIINSVISAYYYWNLARLAWLGEPAAVEAPAEPVRPARWAASVAYLCLVLTLVFAVWFGPLRDLSEAPLAGPDEAPAPIQWATR